MKKALTTIMNEENDKDILSFVDKCKILRYMVKIRRASAHSYLIYSSINSCLIANQIFVIYYMIQPP